MLCKVKAKTKIRAHTHTHPIPESKKRNHGGYSKLSDTTNIVSPAIVTQKRHPKHLISIKVCHQKKQTSTEGGLVGPRHVGHLRPGGGLAARSTQEPTLARSTKDSGDQQEKWQHLDARCQKAEGTRQLSGIPKDTRTLAVPESRSRSAPACRSSTRNIILAVITVLCCAAVAAVTFADRTASVPPKRAPEHSAPLCTAQKSQKERACDFASAHT